MEPNYFQDFSYSDLLGPLPSSVVQPLLGHPSTHCPALVTRGITNAYLSWIRDTHRLHVCASGSLRVAGSFLKAGILSLWTDVIFSSQRRA